MIYGRYLLKGILWVKYEPYWAKGREDMLWTSYLVQTDGWTDKQTDRRMDGQTNHCKGPAERGPKNDWDKRQDLFIYVQTE